MIIGISFWDVLRLPEFKNHTIFSLLDRKNDAFVLPHCFLAGADIDKPYLVQACKHFTVDKIPALGYRYVFLERTDKQWMSGPYASMAARIESQTDKHLAADMIRMSAEGLGWKGYKEMAIKATGLDGTVGGKSKKDIVEDYDTTAAAMKILQAIQIAKRGPLHMDEDMLFDLLEEEEEYEETE